MGLGAKRFEEARQKDITEYLISIGCKGKGKSFNCPICGGTQKLGVKDNKGFCFKCNFKGSIIDLVEATRHCNSIEAVNYLLEGNVIKVDFEALRKKDDDEKLKQQRLFHQMLSNCKSLDDKGLEYLYKRGLQGVEKLLNTKEIEIYSNEYKGLETVVYHFKRYKFAIQKAVTKNDNGKRYVHCYGSNQPVLYYNLRDRPIIITEGIEDSLSALRLGYNFICLNGVKNSKAIVKSILDKIEWSKDKKFLVALDNDEAGLEALEIIETELKDKINLDLFYNYYDVANNKRLKDFNEYLLYLQKGEYI